MGEEICFDDYLRSLVSAYQQWWRLYTLTDATGRESQRVERDRIAPAFFDFGLMVQVQTVDKEKVESQKEKGEEEKKEKIERLPVLEGICKYASDHVLLVGRSGSGKSTALARLLLQEAENALSDRLAKIPVLVELRYLPSEANESSVCDRILAFMHKHDPALNIDEAGIKQLLRQGRLLLLVDGVNELPSDRGRARVNQFRELYQKTCPMIFTTRELSAGGDLGIAKRLEMQPLTEPQMQQFVMAYLPKQGERLLRQLSGRLREFGQTPLLLWMLCSLFQQSEQIPPNLGMVFRAFTVGYRDSKKELLSERLRTWCGRLLQYLAFKMTCGKNLTDARVTIPRQQAESILVDFLKGKVEYPDDCAIRWLNDLLKHHLIQINNDRVEFEHQLIQEYYAAEWLLGLLENQQISYERLQHDYLNYLKWTEPLALMLELVEGEEQAVRVVRLALEVDLRLGARLAGAVKYEFQEKTVGLLIREIEEREIPQGSAIELLGETKSDYTIISLLQFSKQQDADKWMSALTAIGAIGTNKAIESLIQCLEDQDFGIRITVVEVLGSIGSDNAIESLLKSLHDQSPHVRTKVIEALGLIGNDRAVESLIQTLEDQDSDIRIKSIEVLGKIGNKQAVQPLIQSLQDQDSFVCRRAAEALGEIGDERAIEPLFDILRNRDSNRSSEVEALGKITNDETINPVSTDELDIPCLWEFCQSTCDLLIAEIDDAPKAASEALARIGGDQVVKHLIDVLKSCSDEVRRFAVEALGIIGSEESIDVLIESLRDPIYEVRQYSAEALGKIRNNRCIAPLIDLLKDKNILVVGEAICAIEKIGNDQAAEDIICNLQDENNDNYIRRNLIEALGKIASDKGICHLINMLNDPNPDIRGQVAKILGKTGSRISVESLIQSLQDQETNVRSKAVEALGEIGSEQAIEHIIDLLKDNNPNVRKSAARALGEIGNEKAVQPLIDEVFNDLDPYVRESVACALSQIGSYNTVEPLIKVLKDQEHFPYVRAIAAEALGKIGGEEFVEHLIDLLKDENSYIVESVAEVMGKIGGKKALHHLIESFNFRDVNFNYSNVQNKLIGALENIGGKQAIESLIQSLKYCGFDMHLRVQEALINITKNDRNLPTLTQQLPHLLTLIPTEASQEALSVITAIQARCKYYNYDIAQTPLPPEDKSNPKDSQNTFNAPVGQVVIGNLIVQGDNIATQNNQKAPES
ncbi:HEAT repeat domain-containing protein [Pseudanabaena sp. BC1403]|uniref:HEAT repeat domain-containing protein n=1 Tax=Pseudanabaena sp. BC1403 TaxID=2043171 RepID=UPI000CD98A57|nr:HEAT repeat domain-containing protein [Pseudanabaena sp. BC1403]